MLSRAIPHTSAQRRRRIARSGSSEESDVAAGRPAVIAEVNNTFGDRHSYLCVHADGRPIRPEDEMTAAKVFHVSPFQDIAGGYTFRFRLSEGAVAVHIRHERDTPDGPRGLIAARSA